MDYDLLARQLEALLGNEPDPIANAANFAAFIFAEIPDVNWAGFYYADDRDDLVLGPFQGAPACARLPKGRGVCGAAFARNETLVVDDVSQFADHIVCDTASRSELVVPLPVDNFRRGVFDLDSPSTARFRPEDAAGIERLVRLLGKDRRPSLRLVNPSSGPNR